VGPDPDQIELSVFGPGYGECWVVVDSCIDNVTGAPAPLSYLKDIGVDCAQDVKLVVATHWHDDHVRGLSSIVRECKNARFCSSSALTTDEFATLAQLYADRPLTKSTSGLSEMYSIIRHLRQQSTVYPKKAGPDRLIYKKDAGISAHRLGCEIWTLSPSDAQIEQFLSDVSALMPNAGAAKKRAISRSPNHMSVVTWISFGDIAILLGGDLEESSNRELGWAPIVRSTCRPPGRALFFKIPHHGSANAHSDDVWNEMISANGYAVLTPYARGRKSLPTNSDILRIRQRTNAAYITNPNSAPIGQRRSREVQKMINATVRSIKAAEPVTGTVRFRNGGENDPDTWTVTTLNGACRIDDIS
jgi:hypothetical protein